SEKRLLLVGKICTLSFGGIIIAIALLVNHLRSMGLFDLTNLLSGGLLMPMALPLLFGLFYSHTPGWSAWSTALVGFVWFLVVKTAFTRELMRNLLRLSRALSSHEFIVATLAITTLGSVLLGSAWYFF